MDNQSDRVSTIISALRRLTIELEYIHNRRRQPELVEAELVVAATAVRIEAPRDIAIAAERLINIGDTVRITNSYKQLQGTCGRLVKKTRYRGTLVTVSGAEYVRSLSNLELV